MFCPKCGTTNHDKAEFCTSCGTRFQEYTPKDAGTLETPSPSMHLDWSSLIGRTIDAYRITDKLGEGGMGAVFLAEHVSLKQSRAIKILPRDLARNKSYIVRFFKEAQSVAAIDHPNIVRVFDARESDGYYFFAMEYVEGENFAEILSRRGSLPWREALDVIKQVLKAFKAAHGKNIIHRDIKPENIMLGRDGTVKVADFGLAKHVGETTNLTQTGQVMGTPSYMSPEQCQGEKMDQRSDIYSLGATYYTMVAGRTMFRADTPLAVLQMHCFKEPEPISGLAPEIPAKLASIIHKMVAKNRDTRYENAGELLDAIEEFEAVSGAENLPHTEVDIHERRTVLPHEPTPETAVKVEVPAGPPRKEFYPLVLAVLAAVFLAGAAVGGFFLLKPKLMKEKPHATTEPETTGAAAVSTGRTTSGKVVEKRVEKLNKLHERIELLIKAKAVDEAVEAFAEAELLYKGNLKTAELYKKFEPIKIEYENNLMYEKLCKEGKEAVECDKHSVAEEKFADALDIKPEGIKAIEGLEKAIAELNRLEKTRETKEAHDRLCKKGFEEIEKGNLQEAVLLFDEALEKIPDSKKAQKGKDAAKEKWRLIELQKRKNEHDQFCREGREEIDNGNLEEAVYLFDEALFHIPNSQEAIKGKAKALGLLEAGRERLEKYENAIAEGYKFMEDDKPDKAVEAFKKALKFKPGDNAAQNEIRWALETLAAASCPCTPEFAMVAQKRGAEFYRLPIEKTVDLGEGVKMVFALIPHGSFEMGSPDSQPGRDNNEGPVHHVRIYRPFYMGKYEVTQAQWERIMRSNPGKFKNPDNPVEGVSWNDCRKFLKNLNEVKEPGTFYMPSEAQWEYACRAGTNTPFNFGKTISIDQANYDGNFTYNGGKKGEFRNKTSPVGGFPANAWGLHDMHGNVWEWCSDLRTPYPGSGQQGPRWPNRGVCRILRGGSWFLKPEYLRSSTRIGVDPAFCGIKADFGLRVIFVPPALEFRK